MKIEEYIHKHDLVLFNDINPRNGANAAMNKSFYPASLGSPEINDHIQLYTNKENTRWVCINLTKNAFKICHSEMIVIESDWLSSEGDYKVD